MSTYGLPLAVRLVAGISLAVLQASVPPSTGVATAAGAAADASRTHTAPASAAAAALPTVRAYVGGRLLDGTGSPPLADSVIVVRGERIEAVGTVASTPIPPDAVVVSTEGLTVLPGLWDLQVRLTRLGHADDARWWATYLPIAERVVMPVAARSLLLAGVTSARDVGAPPGAAVTIRDRIRDWRIPGPALRVAGPVLEAAPPADASAYRWAIATPAEAQARVARLAQAGVDLVLVADVDRLAPGVLAAVVAAARAARLPVHAEVRRDADVALALVAGVDGLVGFGNGTSAEWPEDAVRALRSRAAAGRPVPWTAGVSALTNYEWLRINPEPLDESEWKAMLPALVAQDVRGSLADPAAVRAFEMPAVRRPLVGPRLRSARAAGALVLVGSDAGAAGHFHPRATWQEIEALVVDGGWTPLEAIRAATLDAATASGLAHESGSVTPGKYADLIAVRGDPLRHVERLRDVEIVVARGVRYL